MLELVRTERQLLPGVRVLSVKKRYRCNDQERFKQSFHSVLESRFLFPEHAYSAVYEASRRLKKRGSGSILLIFDFCCNRDLGERNKELSTD